MVFIDLAKAFDSVNRKDLWMILHKIGCPDKFINVIRFSSTRARKDKSLNQGYYLTSLNYPMVESKVVYWHLYISASSSP